MNSNNSYSMNSNNSYSIDRTRQGSGAKGSPAGCPGRRRAGSPAFFSIIVIIISIIVIIIMVQRGLGGGRFESNPKPFQGGEG